MEISELILVGVPKEKKILHKEVGKYARKISFQAHMAQQSSEFPLYFASNPDNWLSYRWFRPVVCFTTESNLR